MSPNKNFWTRSWVVIASFMLIAAGFLIVDYSKIGSADTDLLSSQKYVKQTAESLESSTLPSVSRLPGSVASVQISTEKYLDTDSRQVVIADLRSGEKEKLFETTYPISLMKAISSNLFGYVTVGSVEESFPSLYLHYLSDLQASKVLDNAGKPYSVADWVPVTDTKIVLQENETNLVYLYDTDSKISTLIGRFDTIGGLAGEGQIWFDDATSSKRITLFSVDTGTNTLVEFPSSQDHIVTQISLLPSGDILWRFTGVESGSDSNTQNIIFQSSSGYYRTVYSTLQKDQQFLNPIQFNTDGSLISISLQNQIGNSETQIISTFSGRSLKTFTDVTQIWFLPATEE